MNTLMKTPKSLNETYQIKTNKINKRIVDKMNKMNKIKNKNQTRLTGRSKKRNLRCLKTFRGHLQLITKRTRSLNIEILNENIAILSIETTILYTTLWHNSDGIPKNRITTNVSSKNLGLVNHFEHPNLVKLIQMKDLPKILFDVKEGVPFNKIQYSSWPSIDYLKDYDSEIQRQNNDSRMEIYNPINSNQVDLDYTDRLIRGLFLLPNTIYMSAYKTTSFTYRFIKRIGDWIRF